MHACPVWIGYFQIKNFQLTKGSEMNIDIHSINKSDKYCLEEYEKITERSIEESDQRQKLMFESQNPPKKLVSSKKQKDKSIEEDNAEFDPDEYSKVDTKGADRFLKKLKRLGLLEQMISNPKGLPANLMKEFLGLSQGSRLIIFDVLSLHRDYREKELRKKLDKAKTVKKKKPKREFLDFQKKRDSLTSERKKLELGDQIVKVKSRINHIKSANRSAQKKIDLIEEKKIVILEKKIDKQIRLSDIESTRDRILYEKYPFITSL